MKKYLVILPIMASCSHLSSTNNMMGGEGYNNQVDNMGFNLSKSDSLVSLPSYDIAPIFKYGLRTSKILDHLNALKDYIEKSGCFPNYDSVLDYVYNLVNPYKANITGCHMLAAAYIGFKAFGEALCKHGVNVNKLEVTRILSSRYGSGLNYSALHVSVIRNYNVIGIWG